MKRRVALTSRRPPVPIVPAKFTPTLSGPAGAPVVSAAETLFLGKRITVTITLGGILGIALFSVQLNDGTPAVTGLGALASVTLTGALSPVTLTFAAGTYVQGNAYTGVI
jgi:hypothetical protein